MGTIVIDEQFDSWRIMLKNELSSKRYMHSIGVCNTSACLAMRYVYDIKKAYAAGLLHDCAKGLSEKKMLQLTERSGIELSEIERENPELLHAKAGSVVAAEKYEVNDTEILDAIRFHTTGRPSMTMLEKIVFTADYIEPSRDGIPCLDEIRQMAFKDIDAAVAMICKNSIDYLKRKRRMIDPITIETYKYYSTSGKEE